MGLPLRVNASPASSSAGTPNRPRILIADDCDGTREVVARMLDRHFDPVTVDNGSSAWSEIETDPSIVALVADIDMPGLTGLELLQHVRGSADPRVRALPIIVITAAADPTTRQRTFVAGATGLVNKPIDAVQLKGLMQAYVHAETETAATSPSVPAAAEPIADALELPAAPETDNAPMPATSIDFTVDMDIGEADAVPTPQAPVVVAEAIVEQPTVAPFAPAGDPLAELSVDELERLIEQETRQQRGVREEPKPAAPTASAVVVAAPPAELLSIDNALALLRGGQGDRLRPYVDHLQQQLQPLLVYCREHAAD
jgi:CheY-like chemotaxis protein